MVIRFKHFFTPSAFQHEDKLVARILHYMLIVIIGITLAFICLSALFGISGSAWWINWVALAGFVMLYGLLHLSYVRLTAWIFCVLMWGLVTLGGVEGRGLADAHFAISSVLVVVMANVLLNRRGGITFIILVIASSIVFFYLYPYPGFTADKSAVLLNLFLDDSIIIAVGVFTGYSVHCLNKALIRAEQSERQLGANVNQLKVEIAERELAEKALRISEENERYLQTRLRRLNEVSVIIAQKTTVESLCEDAVTKGWQFLNFDRVTIGLLDDHQAAKIVMQIDANGVAHTIRSAQKAQFVNHYVKPLEVSSIPTVKVQNDIGLIDHEGHVASNGWQLTEGLYDHHKLIGWIGVDNLAQKKPLQPSDVEVLRLYALTLEHLFSRQSSEQALVKMAFEKERVELVNELISNLSHDLRTPLSIIKTSAYLLKHVQETERQHEKIAIIQDQTERLEKLIADIMTMIKLDQSETITMKPTDLNDIIEKFLPGFRVALEKRQQKFDLQLDAQIPFVLGSADGINRILTNLLENASQYTPENGSISLRTSMVERMIIMEVTDSGIGIHEEDLPHIFERFYRADRARSLKSGGMGLGLAITKRLVEMQSGRIEVSSALGSGTTFKVFFQRSAISNPNVVSSEQDGKSVGMAQD